MPPQSCAQGWLTRNCATIDARLLKVLDARRSCWFLALGVAGHRTMNHPNPGLVLLLALAIMSWQVDVGTIRCNYQIQHCWSATWTLD
jgi:hypothetical protein